MSAANDKATSRPITHDQTSAAEVEAANDATTIIEAARRDDARAIARVLQRNAAVKTLILQPEWSIARHIQEFVVARGPHQTVEGCAQLRWHRPRLAEISSVAILPSQQSMGLGHALVSACIEQATRRDPRLLWVATESPQWFERLGFERMSMWSVPLPVLLERFGSVFQQSWKRWPGSLLGRHVFMRWSGRE